MNNDAATSLSGIAKDVLRQLVAEAKAADCGDVVLNLADTVTLSAK